MATPEYIDNQLAQSLPQYEPQPNQPIETEFPSRPLKKALLTKPEMMLISAVGVLATILLFGLLLTQVVLSNQNRSLQDLTQSNQALILSNSNLEQEVQELSRYNRVMEIAEEMGLEMDELNVRNVTR